jgi:hypothetical protein
MEATMNDRRRTTRTIRRTLPSLVLAALAAALALSATAIAEPIVTIPPTDVAGTDASGTVDSDPQADVCLGNEHSGADPADSSVVQLNDASCASGGGGSGPTGGGTPTGTSGASGTSGAATRGSAVATVDASNAVGLRIVGVRKLMKNVRLNRNFRLIVTVKDTRGLLVRGAIVSVGRAPGSTRSVSGLHAGFSNKTGVARVIVPVTRPMFGKRLYLKIAARTPKARAVALRSVLLPRLR